MKYVCPKCGGQLEIWRDDTIETTALIDKETGEIIKESVKHTYFPTAMDLDKFNYTCKKCGYEFGSKDIECKTCDDLDIINKDNDIYNSEYTDCIKNGKIKIEY